ncbi:FUSC family protein [Rhizobium laguerreae]|uniref:FUSC family protein n=1 Tax=Rhizobium laguerreae TaxID=1076926 RepID=UPI001C911C96|nr:FUSC family protein [Rhizobium laguerreae]MBY3537550.1 FUSC family protein [Rhizobium laguerreae]
MIKAAESRVIRLVKLMAEELAPFPGRLATTWRVSVLTALVAAAAMILQTPEVAVSCYLVIFVMKADSSATIVLAVTLTLLITLIIAVATVLTVLSIGSPGLRLLLMATVSFVMLFIGAASKLGSTGGVVALLVADILSLIYTAPGGEVITSGLRFAWELVALPMMMIVAFSVLLGRSTVSILRDKLLHRLVAAKNQLASPSEAGSQALRDLLRQGNEDALSKLKLVRIFHLVSNKQASQIADDVLASYQLLLAASALTPEDKHEDLLALSSHVGDVVEAIGVGRRPPAPPILSPTACAAAATARQALSVLASEEDGAYLLGSTSPFFASDALSNPEYVRFALKTTAAAMTCYILYAGINWAGIHTAMITCYVVSLRTTGETIHKLGLRILGCLIGAAMGLFSIIFLIPHMHSIGDLMLLICAGTFIAAWISNGSERSSYAGIQVGLAFFLSVLQGFAPGIDLELARDRTVGILLGNTVMYLVATRIWPVGTESALRSNLSKALKGLASLASISVPARQRAVTYAADVGQSAGAMARSFELLLLDPAHLRPSASAQRNIRLISEDAEGLNREIYLSRSDFPGLAQRLNELADGAGRARGMTRVSTRADGAEMAPTSGDQSGNSIEARVRRIEGLIGDANP